MNRIPCIWTEGIRIVQTQSPTLYVVVIVCLYVYIVYLYVCVRWCLRLHVFVHYLSPPLSTAPPLSPPMFDSLSLCITRLCIFSCVS